MTPLVSTWLDESEVGVAFLDQLGAEDASNGCRE